MQSVCRLPSKAYFLPICGTATAPLACLMAEMGVEVSGVDSQLKPPMSSMLEVAGVSARLGWNPEAVPDDVDVVVIGNAVGEKNPEVQRVLELGLPMVSQAGAVRRYVVGGQDALVVCGTHGKTTTTAASAWLLERAGMDPKVLVGGLMRWSGRAYRMGEGPVVLEGDEYTTAFFDHMPKLVHYGARFMVLGPVELDHLDIFEGVEAVLDAFSQGVSRLSAKGGALVFWDGSPLTKEVALRFEGTKVSVGWGSDCRLRIESLSPGPGGAEAVWRWGGRTYSLKLAVAGRHNAQNALMAVAVALAMGVNPSVAADAVSGFPGVARRLQVLGEAAGVVVVDDFAHHPTAVKVTVEAIRANWPERRLVLAYEPRTMSSGRKEFAEAYLDSLSLADAVFLAGIYHASRLDSSKLLDLGWLLAELRRKGIHAELLPDDPEEASLMIARFLRAGDLLVACSSGDFRGLPQRVLSVLREASGKA